jgi:CheY-like chemotaxis protein
MPAEFEKGQVMPKPPPLASGSLSIIFSRPTTAQNTVLAIDDDPQVLDLLQRTFAREGVRVAIASSGEEGLRLARGLHPMAITLDVMMPGMDGWAVLTALKDDPEMADIPVIMVSILSERSRGFALGASDYLTKPVDRSRLVALLNKYRSSSDSHQPVLIVDDDSATRDMMQRLLRNLCPAIEATNGKEALERLAVTTPRLVLLDLLMPEMDGFEFLERIRREERWRNLPVAVVTALSLTPDDRKRLQGRVHEVIQKGGSTQEELLGQVSGLLERCRK